MQNPESLTQPYLSGDWVPVAITLNHDHDTVFMLLFHSRKKRSCKRKTGAKNKVGKAPYPRHRNVSSVRWDKTEIGKNWFRKLGFMRECVFLIHKFRKSSDHVWPVVERVPGESFWTASLYAITTPGHPSDIVSTKELWILWLTC